MEGDIDGPGRKLRPGDLVAGGHQGRFRVRAGTQGRGRDLVLEEVPDVGYEDIGGLGRQIEQIRDAVELPFLHKTCSASTRCARPRVCCCTDLRLR